MLGDATIYRFDAPPESVAAGLVSAGVSATAPVALPAAGSAPAPR